MMIEKTYNDYRLSIYLSDKTVSWLVQNKHFCWENIV